MDLLKTRFCRRDFYRLNFVDMLLEGLSGPILQFPPWLWRCNPQKIFTRISSHWGRLVRFATTNSAILTPVGATESNPASIPSPGEDKAEQDRTEEPGQGHPLVLPADGPHSLEPIHSAKNRLKPPPFHADTVADLSFLRSCLNDRTRLGKMAASPCQQSLEGRQEN